MIRNKKLIALAVLSIALISIAVYFVDYVVNTKKVTVSSSNVESVNIYKEDDFFNKLEPISTTPGSTLDTRLRKGDYVVEYIAASDYENGFTKISVTDKEIETTFEPKYSTEKLEQMLTTEKETINKALLSKYPNTMKEYEVGEEILLNYGEWYCATLKYIGTDSLNRDDLKVILKKENNQWSVVTTPPQITVNGLSLENVPEEVIGAANFLGLSVE